MIIESSRLILRLWQENDINDLIEGLNNINVSKWMASIPFPYTQKDAIDFIKYVRNEDNKDMFEENGWEIPTTWSEYTNTRSTSLRSRRT